jgi:hypothetical protein
MLVWIITGILDPLKNVKAYPAVKLNLLRKKFARSRVKTYVGEIHLIACQRVHAAAIENNRQHQVHGKSI